MMHVLRARQGRGMVSCPQEIPEVRNGALVPEASTVPRTSISKAKAE